MGCCTWEMHGSVFGTTCQLLCDGSYATNRTACERLSFSLFHFFGLEMTHYSTFPGAICWHYLCTHTSHTWMIHTRRSGLNMSRTAAKDWIHYQFIWLLFFYDSSFEKQVKNAHHNVELEVIIIKRILFNSQNSKSSPLTGGTRECLPESGKTTIYLSKYFFLSFFLASVVIKQNSRKGKEETEEAAEKRVRS